VEKPEQNRIIKNIAFDQEQVDYIESVKDQLGYGTFTGIVRDAVDYYIQQKGWMGRLDIYRDMETHDE